jgi:6-phosphogluconolactonase
MMQPEVHVAPLSRLIERLADDVRRSAEGAAEKHQRFSIAIPGGSVVPALKPVSFDWSRTHVFWVDERAVPPSSPDSNYGLAQTVWLGPAHAHPSAIHRMPADGPDLEAAANAYSEEIMRVLGEEPRLDVVLLGVGPDGHVASLFPNHPALTEHERLVLPIVDSPKPPPHRLTLTMPMLTGAARVIVMAMGESKAAVMHQALRREDSTLPIAIVLREATSSLVLLDEDAGARLPFDSRV